MLYFVTFFDFIIFDARNNAPARADRRMPGIGWEGSALRPKLRRMKMAPGTGHTARSMRSGFSTHSLTRRRKVTAPLPSTMRWS